MIIFYDVNSNGNYHYGHTCNQALANTPQGSFYNSGFLVNDHVYAVEWFPTNITWYERCIIFHTPNFT